MAAGPVGFRGGSDSISSIQGGAETTLGGGEVRPFSPGYDPAVDPGQGLWVDPNATPPVSDEAFGLDGACGQQVGGVGVSGPITMAQVTGLIAALASKVTQTAFDALVAQFEQHLLDGDGGGSSPTVVGYIAETRLDDETGFRTYDGTGALSTVLWADLSSGVTVFVRDSGRVCTADGGGSYTTVDATAGDYQTESGVVARMPAVGTPSILSPTAGGGGGVTLGQVNAAISAALVSVLADIATAQGDITTLQGLLATVQSSQSTLSTTVGGHTTSIATNSAAIATLLSDLTALQGVVSGKQDHTAELDVLGALSSTSIGRSILTASTASVVVGLLGLGNVNNTSDADKPVSTLQAAAISAAQAAAVAAANSYADGLIAGLVPTSRTINGHPLSGNVTISVGDIAGLQGQIDGKETAGAAAAAQAAAIAAAATDATTKADAKVADAINDGITTVAPSQNAVFDALATKADLASPALTGNPTAPTQTVSDNSTRLATTAYVTTAVATKLSRQRPVGASGQYALPFSSIVSQGGIATGVAKDILVLAGWFTIPQAVTITAVQFRYTGGASTSALIRIGLFSLTDIGGTYTLVNDIGTVSGATPGTYQLTGLSITIQPGTYCFGWVHNSTGSVTAVNRVWAPFGGALYHGGEAGANVFYASATKAFTYGNLATITSPTVAYDTNYPSTATGSAITAQWTE